MSRTVTIHSVFVTAKLASSCLIAIQDVLQCDKVSWFCHIEAATAGFVDLARVIGGDNGLHSE
jgi:hypothetical protein